MIVFTAHAQVQNNCMVCRKSTKLCHCSLQFVLFSNQNVFRWILKCIPRASCAVEYTADILFYGAKIHAGATVNDSLPHGSFFHATGGAVYMDIKERMKLIPYEAMIGGVSTIVSVLVYLIAG